MHPGMNGTGELSFAVSTLVVTYFALPAVLEVCGSRAWSHFSVPRTPRCLVSGEGRRAAAGRDVESSVELCRHGSPGCSWMVLFSR